MLQPIGYAPNICSSQAQDCTPPPSCSSSMVVVQPCPSLDGLPAVQEFRESPWFIAFINDGIAFSDEDLIAALKPYRRYMLRCAHADSILLAYFHFRDSRKKQELEILVLENSIQQTGIRKAKDIDLGWGSTSYGAAYLDLQSRQDVWGGGRFDSASDWDRTVRVQGY